MDFKLLLAILAALCAIGVMAANNGDEKNSSAAVSTDQDLDGKSLGAKTKTTTAATTKTNKKTKKQPKIKRTIRMQESSPSVIESPPAAEVQPASANASDPKQQPQNIHLNNSGPSSQIEVNPSISVENKQEHNKPAEVGLPNTTEEEKQPADEEEKQPGQLDPYKPTQADVAVKEKPIYTVKDPEEEVKENKKETQVIDSTQTKQQQQQLAEHSANHLKQLISHSGNSLGQALVNTNNQMMELGTNNNNNKKVLLANSGNTEQIHLDGVGNNKVTKISNSGNQELVEKSDSNNNNESSRGQSNAFTPNVQPTVAPLVHGPYPSVGATSLQSPLVQINLNELAPQNQFAATAAAPVGVISSVPAGASFGQLQLRPILVQQQPQQVSPMIPLLMPQQPPPPPSAKYLHELYAMQQPGFVNDFRRPILQQLADDGRPTWPTNLLPLVSPPSPQFWPTYQLPETQWIQPMAPGGMLMMMMAPPPPPQPPSQMPMIAMQTPFGPKLVAPYGALPMPLMNPMDLWKHHQHWLEAPTDSSSKRSPHLGKRKRKEPQDESDGAPEEDAASKKNAASKPKPPPPAEEEKKEKKTVEVTQPTKTVVLHHHHEPAPSPIPSAPKPSQVDYEVAEIVENQKAKSKPSAAWLPSVNLGALNPLRLVNSNAQPATLEPKPKLQLEPEPEEEVEWETRTVRVPKRRVVK